MEYLKTLKKTQDLGNFFKMFWVFIIFSIVGTLSEGLFWILKYGHYETRSGLVYGPFSEVYGFAVLLAIILLKKDKAKSAHLIFIKAYIISVSFELFCSFFQEWVFGYTSWDYSNSNLAIFGRANLIYAVPWALFGVLLIKQIYPRLSRLMDGVKGKAINFVTWALFVFMVFNFAVSSAAVIRFDQRQNKIPATNFIQEQMDKHYPDEYLKEKFSRILKGRP